MSLSARFRAASASPACAAHRGGGAHPRQAHQPLRLAGHHSQGETNLNIRRTLITAAAAAALILGLTGCTAPGDAVDGMLDPIFGGAAATATPTATATPVPLAGDVAANGKIDTWEAEQLAKGQYAMADGSTVKLVKGEPIPEVVKADIVAKTEVEHEALQRATSAGRGPASGAFMTAVRANEVLIGKRIITVISIYQEDFGGDAWCVGGDAASRDGCRSTEAEGLAYAKEWVGGQTQYTIINFG